MRFASVIDSIGHTPLVRLRTPRSDVHLYAKLELANPFAMKDRVARGIITHARATGILAPGDPIMESSSGTMALGVALVGTLLGHPVHIVTDPRIDPITLAKLNALGAVVHVVEKMDAHGWQGARLTRLAELMAEHPGAFWPRQYENPQNPAAYRTLAEELVADVDRVDVLVGAVGSGGSLCGSARALRAEQPWLRTIGVDAVGSVIFGQPDRAGRLQSGLGNSLVPPNVDHAAIDEIHWLNDHEAFAATRALAAKQGIFAGNTSGSAYRVACWVAEHADPGTTVVAILPDRGDRYTDTVYDDALWARHRLAERPLRPAPVTVPAGLTVTAWSRQPAQAGAPTVVFVESNTTGSGMQALRAATRLGFRAVLLAADPDRYPDAAAAATVVRCGTDGPPAGLASQLSGIDVSAVTTTSEFYVGAAAALADHLGLPSRDAAAIATCRDKAALRAALDAVAGLHQPRHATVRRLDEVAAAVATVGLPCVVKPVDDSGSAGVRLCRSSAEVAAAVAPVLDTVRNGRGQPTARTALVEDYLDGPEFSVEMLGEPGGQRLLGVVAKTVGGEPHFVEQGHVLPADVPAEVADALKAAARAALDAVGLRSGLSHTEVRLTARGPAIIEINPRLAGGMIPELFQLVHGVDLLELQVRDAVGVEVALPREPSGYAGIRVLTAAAAGRLAGVRGLDAARAVPGVEQVAVTADAGRPVAPAVDAYGRLGYVIARGETAARVRAALVRAVRLIEIDVVAETAA